MPFTSPYLDVYFIVFCSILFNSTLLYYILCNSSLLYSILFYSVSDCFSLVQLYSTLSSHPLIFSPLNIILLPILKVILDNIHYFLLISCTLHILSYYVFSVLYRTRLERTISSGKCSADGA